MSLTESEGRLQIENCMHRDSAHLLAEKVLELLSEFLDRLLNARGFLGRRCSDLCWLDVLHGEGRVVITACTATTMIGKRKVASRTSLVTVTFTGHSSPHGTV